MSIIHHIDLMSFTFDFVPHLVYVFVSVYSLASDKALNLFCRKSQDVCNAAGARRGIPAANESLLPLREMVVAARGGVLLHNSAILVGKNRTNLRKKLST